MTAPVIAGLILAGGASRRMGSPKALLTIENQTFIDRLASFFLRACSPVVVVLGHGSDTIRAGMKQAEWVRITVNPHPECGMLSSLHCGLAAIPKEAEAVIFTPVDYPAIRATTVARLAGDFAEHRAPVTLPTHEGRKGHPVCVSRDVIAQLLAQPMDADARDVIRSFRDQTRFVEVADPGILHDIDHPEDYELLQRQLACAES